MIDLKKYTNNKDDLMFLEELYDCFSVHQTPQVLKCGDYSFQVDPEENGASVWRNGERIEKFETIDELFLKFIIDGKPLIERIDELEYDD